MSEVREMGVSEARANMTDVIAQARLLDVDFVLTRRDKPQAVLLSVKRYEQAQAAQRTVDALHAYLKALPDEERNEAVGALIQRVLDTGDASS